MRSRTPSEGFDFEVEEVRSWLRRNGAKRVLLEAPNGLKEDVLREVVPELADWEVTLSTKPMFGACEVDDSEAIQLGVDHVIHFGHMKMVSRKTPTLYVPVYYRFDAYGLAARVQKALEVPPEDIAIASTAQYLWALPVLARVLRKSGYRPLIGKKGNRTAARGQVLGCDYTALLSVPQAKEFVLLASGEFHPMGAALALGKPLLLADPFEGIIKRIRPEDYKSWTAREAGEWLAFLQTKKAAIVEGSLPGQKFPRECDLAAKQLRREGMKVVQLSSQYLDPAQLDALPLDSLVLGACPRLPLDDLQQFKKPVISVFSVLTGSYDGVERWLRSEGKLSQKLKN